MTVSDHAPPAPATGDRLGRWVIRSTRTPRAARRRRHRPRPGQLSAGSAVTACVFDSVAQHKRDRVAARRGARAAMSRTSSPPSCTTRARRTWATCRTRSSTAAPLGAAFKEAEDHLERAIPTASPIKPDVPEVKRADRALLAAERRAFSAETWHWPELDGVEPLDRELVAWSPDAAADAFAKRFAELEARRQATAVLGCAGRARGDLRSVLEVRGARLGRSGRPDRDDQAASASTRKAGSTRRRSRGRSPSIRCCRAPRRTSCASTSAGSGEASSARSSPGLASCCPASS